jgi:hypothetical protein
MQCRDVESRGPLLLKMRHAVSLASRHGRALERRSVPTDRSGARISDPASAGSYSLAHEASGPDSPINDVPRLCENAKRIYAYLADLTLRFGASHSRVRTVAHVAHISEYKALKAIRELERRGLISHKSRNTWHGRGAHDYHVHPVRRD